MAKEKGNNNEQLTYESAVEELNTLVERVEDKESSFGQVEKDVKRAMELIAFCKNELKGYRERFEQIQAQSSADNQTENGAQNQEGDFPF
ncbi:MAG: exodeoxyribonuclease VII small subunit [Bacteroidales bacterium]|nr:exodeoxyribonuclease VII small subunit [Bacteroidales bacterium]